MGEEVVDTTQPQLAFALTDDRGNPIAETSPKEPTDLSPEEVKRLREDASEQDREEV